MPQPLVVFTLEALTPAALGCYGSSWNATPVIDSVAAGGQLWDRCLVARDDPAGALNDLVSLLHRGAAELGRTELLIDGPQPLASLGATAFDLMEVIAGDWQADSGRPAEDLIDTALGQLLAAAIDRLARPALPDVLWIHSGYLARRWDAPRGLDSDTTGLPADDDAPPAMFDTVIPPQLRLDGTEHPDLVTSWMQTYGCQVALLDQLLEPLLEQVAARGRILVLAGISGFRLGQGGWIGHRCGPLRSRDIHVPLLRSGGGPLRFPQLGSLSDWFWEIVREGNEDAEHRDARCESLFTQGCRGPVTTASTRALQATTTPEWFLVRDRDESDHLFLKPDDIDDVNDVARLRPDVVAELAGQQQPGKEELRQEQPGP